MNASFIGSKLLASGQSAPFTGDWISIAEARNTLFAVYGSGASSLSATIQTKTFLFGDPAFQDGGSQQGVPLYIFSSIPNGYAAPAVINAPVSHVRIVASGTGQVWSYVSIKN
jgi:hypothetical protein